MWWLQKWQFGRANCLIILWHPVYFCWFNKTKVVFERINQSVVCTYSELFCNKSALVTRKPYAWTTSPEVYKTWVHSRAQNKVQWLVACGHVSASSQSLRFILSLSLYSSFITSGPGRSSCCVYSFAYISHTYPWERWKNKQWNVDRHVAPFLCSSDVFMLCRISAYLGTSWSIFKLCKCGI